jgi:hypothetical protein
VTSALEKLVLEELQRSPRKHALVKEGLEFISQVDPAAALEWAQQNIQGNVRDLTAGLPEHDHEVVLTWK